MTVPQLLRHPASRHPQPHTCWGCNGAVEAVGEALREGMANTPSPPLNVAQPVNLRLVRRGAGGGRLGTLKVKVVKLSP